MTIGFLVLAGLVSVRLGLAGAVLAFLTPFVTLSFLVTTPEAWVPALGDAQHGFPYLSGAGLVLKDTVILAGGWLLVVDGARAILAQMARHPEAERADWNRSVAPARVSARRRRQQHTGPPHCQLNGVEVSFLAPLGCGSDKGPSAERPVIMDSRRERPFGRSSSICAAWRIEDGYAEATGPRGSGLQ